MIATRLRKLNSLNVDDLTYPCLAGAHGNPRQAGKSVDKENLPDLKTDRLERFGVCALTGRGTDRDIAQAHYPPGGASRCGETR